MEPSKVTRRAIDQNRPTSQWMPSECHVTLQIKRSGRSDEEQRRSLRSLLSTRARRPPNHHLGHVASASAPVGRGPKKGVRSGLDVRTARAVSDAVKSATSEVWGSAIDRTDLSF